MDDDAAELRAWQNCTGEPIAGKRLYHNAPLGAIRDIVANGFRPRMRPLHQASGFMFTIGPTVPRGAFLRATLCVPWPILNRFIDDSHDARFWLFPRDVIAELATLELATPDDAHFLADHALYSRELAERAPLIAARREAEARVTNITIRHPSRRSGDTMRGA